MIKKIIGLLFLLISLNIFAQRTNNSPYSIFGIGENSNTKTVEEMGMGEVGGAFNSTYLLNFTNPAALAHLRLTNYSIGGQNRAIQLNDGTNKASASNASFSYLAIGFPIGQKAGLSFGIKPYSTVGYSLSQETFDNAGDLSTLNQFNGEGGTNSVFVGFGHKIGKNLSAGIEGSYIFGSIENSLLNRRNGVPLATLEKTDSDVRAFRIKGGIQYVGKINEKITLKAGLAVELENELSDDGNRYRISTINIPNPTTQEHRDTIINQSFKNTITIPTKTTLSAGIGKENNWYAGLEYEFQDALSFEEQLTQNATFQYDKSSRISLGGFYTPKINSISSYWQRITYRAGFKYQELGLLVNNTSINDFGISFGVGLPIGKQLSNINLGIELGQRGETTNNLVRENYLNFRVAFSLTDRWFRKQKLN